MEPLEIIFPHPLLKQGQLEQVVQGHVHLGFGYLHG